MQRVILAMVAALAFTGCAMNRIETDAITTQNISAAVEFGRYEKTGFMFSPHAASGKHKVLGVASISTIPGIRYIGFEEDPNNPEAVVSKFRWERDVFNAQSGADSIYRWAKALGGNAISDFRIETSTTSLLTGMPLFKITISGTAIIQGHDSIR